MEEQYFLGIDLGTTNTVVAYTKTDNENNIQYLTLDGSKLIPSIIALDTDGNILYGQRAKRRISATSDIVAYYKLGLLEPTKTYNLGDKKYTAEELSALFLKYIREELFKHLQINSNEQIAKVVISKPAAFTHPAIRSTYEATKSAGFDVELPDLISEPVAACFHYPFNESDRYVKVYDLGGGTFDCAIVDNKLDADNKKRILSVEGSGELKELGGRKFDECILKIVEEKENLTIDREDAISYNRILLQCQKVKEELTENKSAKLEYNYKGENYEFDITKTEFENKCEPIVLETIRVCEEALQSANMNFSEINKILLVGGSTYMPIIQHTLREKFGEQRIVFPDNDADTIVATGALICAMKRFNQDTDGGFIESAQSSYGSIILNSERTGFTNTIMIAKDEDLPQTCNQEAEAPGSVGVFYSSTYTGQQILARENSDIDPTDPAVSLLEIFTVENIKPPYNVNIIYSLSEGEVPIIKVEQEGNNDLKFRSERMVDKSCLDIDMYKQVSKPKYIMLAIDISGSMDNQPIKNVKEYIIKSLLPKYKEKSNVYFGVMGYTTDCEVFQNFTNNLQIVEEKVRAIRESGGGGTSAIPFNDKDYGNREVKAIEEFSKLPENVAKILVFLADGAWSGNRIDDLKTSAKECNNNGIETIGIYFGSGNKELITELSSKQPIFLDSTDDLEGGFNDLIAIIGD